MEMDPNMNMGMQEEFKEPMSKTKIASIVGGGIAFVGAIGVVLYKKKKKKDSEDFKLNICGLLKKLRIDFVLCGA